MNPTQKMYQPKLITCIRDSFHAKDSALHQERTPSLPCVKEGDAEHRKDCPHSCPYFLARNCMLISVLVSSNQCTVYSVDV